MSDTTRDGFLDGRLTIEQPKDGYRAGADPVLLAASVEVKTGGSVLELGCGAGTALFCLGWRLGAVELCGLERDAYMAELARRNATANAVDVEIITGDVSEMPPELRSQRFDAVLLNPPFFDRRRGTRASGPREAGRGEGEACLRTWLSVASRRLSPKGRLSMIQRIERLPESLSSLDRTLGDVTVRPVAARQGDRPERFILTAKKGARGPFRLLPTLVLHGDDHSDTPSARAILRDGLSLEEAMLTNR